MGVQLPPLPLTMTKTQARKILHRFVQDLRERYRFSWVEVEEELQSPDLDPTVKEAYNLVPESLEHILYFVYNFKKR